MKYNQVNNTPRLVVEDRVHRIMLAENWDNKKGVVQEAKSKLNKVCMTGDKFNPVECFEVGNMKFMVEYRNTKVLDKMELKVEGVSGIELTIKMVDYLVKTPKRNDTVIIIVAIVAGSLILLVTGLFFFKNKSEEDEEGSSLYDYKYTGYASDDSDDGDYTASQSDLRYSAGGLDSTAGLNNITMGTELSGGSGAETDRSMIDL